MKKLYLLSAMMLILFVNIGIVLSQTCPTDMVAYWKLEEVGETNLSDYISNHDAISSSVLTNVVDGRVGNAKYFDGTKSASVSDHSDFAFGVNSSFSVEFWAKIPGTGSTQVLVGKRDSNSSGAYWFIGLQSSGRIFFEVQDSDGVFREIVSPSSIATDTWRHIVAVRDEATNANYLYVDGAMVVSTIYNYTGGFNCDGALTLGCFNNSSGIPSYFYTGSLDEVAVFSRAISATEISAHKMLGDNGIGYCDGYAPSFISAPNVKATVGSLYSYKAHATGLQTDMTYSLITRPTGMTIDSQTGEINWLPSSVYDDGSVTIMADNNVAPADTQSYRIFIAEAPDCPTGLTVLLKLDESAGPEYADFYGAHNATAIISPTATVGIVSGAQEFNSITGMDIPDNGTEFDWAYQDNWSVEFWMKSTNAATMVAVGRHRKAGDYDTLANWWAGTNAGGLATFSLQDNNLSSPKLFEISGGPYLLDDQWHHIIAVREGSIQQNRLYVDGIEATSVTTNYGNSFRMDVPTEVSVGYWKRAYPSENEYHFVGVLDEVAIFNKAINSGEAAGFYNVGVPAGHCTPGNYAPVITSIPVETATQDAAYSYLMEVDDVDVEDPITLSAVVKPDWLNFDTSPGQKTGLLSGTPTNSEVGIPANITLRVSDGHVEVDQIFVITVQNVNDLPTITSEPSDTVDENVLYTYTLTVEDIDPSDIITMTAVTLPEWMTFTWTPGTRTATLEGTPTDTHTGNNPIDILISDGTADIHEAYTLYVNPINSPPVITGQNTLAIDEDNPTTLTIGDFTVEDSDNVPGELTLSVLAGNNYSFSGNTVTPDADFNGVLSVPVTVSDPESASDVFNTVLTVNAVNDKPVINSTPDLLVIADKLYAYSLDATDVDGDDLVYSAITIPLWLTFFESNGILTGTPTADHLGEHLVVLNVSDGTDDVEHSFILSVSFAAGIKDHIAKRFSIYPSPATDMLYLEFETLTEDATAYIFNNSGILVKSVNIPRSADRLTLEISELSSGSYHCVLRNSLRNQTLKFLVTE